MFLGALVFEHRPGKERSQKAKSRRIVFTRCSLALRARSRAVRFANRARSLRQKSLLVTTASHLMNIRINGHCPTHFAHDQFILTWLVIGKFSIKMRKNAKIANIKHYFLKINSFKKNQTHWKKW